jgi:hypothetical protein
MLIIASFGGRISMELRHLATFRTLATTLNFTQTAALLGSDVKRMMYGKAGFAHLRQRVLHRI